MTLRYHPWFSTRRLFETCSEWLENGMKGFLVRNLESYGMLRHLGWQKYCVLDTSIYTWNNESVSFWKKEGILRNTVPYELNEKEIAHRNNSNSEMIIYGNIPLMLSAQCVRKNTLKCDCNERKMILKDRYEKGFLLLCMSPMEKQELQKKKNTVIIFFITVFPSDF